MTNFAYLITWNLKSKTPSIFPIEYIYWLDIYHFTDLKFEKYLKIYGIRKILSSILALIMKLFMVLFKFY